MSVYKGTTPGQRGEAAAKITLSLLCETWLKSEFIQQSMTYAIYIPSGEGTQFLLCQEIIGFMQSLIQTLILISVNIKIW